MIVIEAIETENRERRYSDRNVMIRQTETGRLYEDAIDAIPCPYTYEETDVPVEAEEATAEDYENALTALGVDL